MYKHSQYNFNSVYNLGLTSTKQPITSRVNEIQIHAILKKTIFSF